MDQSAHRESLDATEICFQGNALSFSGMGWTSLPPLKHFAHVKVLEIDDNQLSSVPSSLVRQLPLLEKLNFARNQFHEFPSNIGNWIHLTHINAAYNQITFIPASISGLKNLEYLNMKANPLNSTVCSLVNVDRHWDENGCREFARRVRVTTFPVNKKNDCSANSEPNCKISRPPPPSPSVLGGSGSRKKETLGVGTAKTSWKPCAGLQTTRKPVKVMDDNSGRPRIVSRIPNVVRHVAGHRSRLRLSFGNSTKDKAGTVEEVKNFQSSSGLPPAEKCPERRARSRLTARRESIPNNVVQFDNAPTDGVEQFPIPFGTGSGENVPRSLFRNSSIGITQLSGMDLSSASSMFIADFLPNPESFHRNSKSAFYQPLWKQALHFIIAFFLELLKLCFCTVSLYTCALTLCAVLVDQGILQNSLKGSPLIPKWALEVLLKNHNFAVFQLSSLCVYFPIYKNPPLTFFMIAFAFLASMGSSVLNFFGMVLR